MPTLRISRHPLPLWLSCDASEFSRSDRHRDPRRLFVLSGELLRDCGVPWLYDLENRCEGSWTMWMVVPNWFFDHWMDDSGRADSRVRA